jgi:hypothetical protein
MPTLTVEKVVERTARAKKRAAGKEGPALRQAQKTVRRLQRKRRRLETEVKRRAGKAEAKPEA